MTKEEIKNQIEAFKAQMNQNRTENKGFMLILARIMSLENWLKHTYPEEVNETLEMESKHHLWWSVEIKDNKVVIQPTEQRKKHGALGKVLIPSCTREWAEKIKLENE